MSPRMVGGGFGRPCGRMRDRLILPEGTPIGLGLSHASRLGALAPGGARLSNTRSTCPGDRNNLGKLRLIPDRGGFLEWVHPQSRRGNGPAEAPGWDRGPSGSRWGNGPPSLRRVRAVGAGARRWALRQGPRPYGAQQARNFPNARKREGVSPSAAR